MNLSELRAPKHANEKKKRVGRGMGSGMGKTSTRGHDGQRSRSGSRMMRGFEGGQMPLHRRLPKRGFTNIFREEYSVVNLDRISALEGDTITLAMLQESRIASRGRKVKVLGDGEPGRALTIHAHKFSQSAIDKIEKAGGKAEVIALHTREEHSQTRAPKAPRVRKPRAAPVAAAPVETSVEDRAEKPAATEGSAKQGKAEKAAKAPKASGEGKVKAPREPKPEGK